MSLEARVHLVVAAQEARADDLVSSIRVTSINNSFPFADGTGANQAQVCWGITATCGTSGVQYDMRSLPSDRGNVTVTATKVCYVKNLSTEKHLLLGGQNPLAGDNYNVFPVLDSLTVHESGVFLNATNEPGGFSNTANYMAAFRASAGTAAFQFVIIGEGTAP